MATLDELAEALTSSQTSALLQKIIDQNLVDVFRKEEPLKGALPTKQWAGATYYWNTRNRMPYAQGVTEAPPTTGPGSVSPSQSQYIQGAVPIGHYQVNGDLSKFNVKVATASIENLLQSELNAAAQAMTWIWAMFNLYGSAAATAGSVRPQWDGFDRLMAPSQRLTPNGGAGTILTLLDLDNMIDSVRTRSAGPLPADDFVFICSEPMLSTMGRLVGAQRQNLIDVTLKPRRIDGQGAGVNVADPGIEVPSYRNIPIVATSFLSPYGQMTTLTAAASGSGTTLPATARYYAVEAIAQYGPTYATTTSVTPAAGNNVDISFSTPSALDIFGNAQPILQYRVYQGSSATNMTLYGVVAATDAADVAVTQIRDSGGALTANPLGASVPGQFVGTGITGDGVNLPPPTTPPTTGFDESILLVSRKPEFVVVPTVTEAEFQLLAPTNARTLQYAVTGDCALAMRAPAFASKLQRVKTV